MTKTRSLAPPTGLIGLCSALALLSAGTAPIRAQPTGEHHVVLLVDQSGSMWRAHGPNNGWGANDPQDQRVGMAQQALDALNNQLLQEQDTTIGYNFHVVEFGGDVRTQPPFRLTYDPANPGAPRVLQTHKQNLDGLRRPNGLATDETNILKGLREVSRILDSVSGVARERLFVLLLTDGKPYVRMSPTNEANAADQRQYVHELEQEALTITSRVSHFDVIGLTVNDNRNAYWGTWERFWKRVSSPNTTYEVEDSSDLVEVVDEIIRSWLGLPKQLTAENPFYCPPYQRSIVLTIFKKQPGAQVEIRDGTNRLIAPRVEGVHYVDERNYTQITVIDPTPGLWNFDRQADKIKYLLFPKRLRKLSPRSPANAGVPIRFRYQVLSAPDQTFQELPQYPITALMEVTEGGQASSLVLDLDAGVFAAAQNFEFQASGTAHLAFRATTALPDSRVVEVLKLDQTLPITARDLVVLNAGDSLPALAALRFGRRTIRPAFRLEKFSPAGEAIDPRLVATASDRLLEFRLVRSDGVELAGWPGWQPLELDENGMLTASADMDMPLLSWPWLLRQRQEVFAEIRVDEGMLREEYWIREVLRRDEPAVFDRSKALPALVDNPLALAMVLREGFTSYLAALLLLLAVTALVTFGAFSVATYLGYGLADNLRKQTVTMVIQPVSGDELGAVRKNLTGRRVGRFKKVGQVGISIGDDPDYPEWKPTWLTIKRLFRPWTGRVVAKLIYPIDVAEKKQRFTTEVQEGDRPIRLRGMGKAEAILEVRRHGKLTTEEHAGWGRARSGDGTQNS